MARERSVLTMQQYRSLAHEHATKMNQFIDEANRKSRLQQQKRLGRFVHEALGQMGAQELIDEWLELRVQMDIVQSRFARLMGGKSSISQFAPADRDNLLAAVFTRQPYLGVDFYRELDNVMARHGLQPAEVTEIPRVNVEELVSQLRECKSEEEVMLVIVESQTKIIGVLGLDVTTRKKE